MSDFTAFMHVGFVLFLVIAAVIFAAKMLVSIWPLGPPTQQKKLLRLRTRLDKEPLIEREPPVTKAEEPEPILRLKRRASEMPATAMARTTAAVTASPIERKPREP